MSHSPAILALAALISLGGTRPLTAAMKKAANEPSLSWTVHAFAKAPARKQTFDLSTFDFSTRRSASMSSIRA